MRYIDSLNLQSAGDESKKIKYFILIEPGLGYMIPVLQERFKESKIISLHVKDFPNPLNVQKYLEEQIPEADADRAKIIEWRPSLNYYREAYVNILSQAVDFIKRADAGARTTAAFGKRWVKNFFYNLRMVNKTLLYRQSEIPVIVTGSGPSLEQAIPVIKRAQDNCLIIAASSSVMALSNSGIKPDVIIATDGGSWALWHMYPCYREGAAALAVNLCAALPSQATCTPLLLINDGSFWQNIILHELALPSVLLAQRGTVTATALELAMLLTGGNIYLAGMDFSVNDIRTHTRPYGFDNLFFGRANRFIPYYSESFTRSSLIKKGGSMDIYAAWFKTQLISWPKRIFSIGGYNNIFENGKPSLNGSRKKDGGFFETKNETDTEAFCKRGISALLNALKNPQYAQNLKQELVPLLGQDLEKAIKETAGKVLNEK